MVRKYISNSRFLEIVESLKKFNEEEGSSISSFLKISLGIYPESLKQAEEIDSHPWRFVEQFYPNYHSCSEIYKSDVLQRIVDFEFDLSDSENAAVKLLFSDYGGNPSDPHIKLDLHVLNCKIYERAIEEFLKQQ